MKKTLHQQKLLGHKNSASNMLFVFPFPGDYSALTSTQPVFVSLLSNCAQHEALDFSKVFFLVAFLGSIILITRPPIIFGDLASTSHERSYYIGIVATLIGIFCQAAAYVFTRSLQVSMASDLNSWNFVAYFDFLLICCLISTHLLLLLIFWKGSLSWLHSIFQIWRFMYFRH